MIDKLEAFCLNILRKIKLGKLADMYEEHIEGMRYTIFGGLSTVLNIIIFIILTELINWPTTISNFIAWVAGVTFSYVTNKLFVFYSKADGKLDLIREIIAFYGARIATGVAETIFLIIVIDKLGFNSVIMKIISNIVVIILNYVLSKLFIFKDKKKENQGEENEKVF